jgi:hypothetical protein
MEFTVSVTAPAKLAALTKAAQAYNASVAQPLSLGEFVQKLVDGQLDGLVKAYVIAQMDPFTWLKTRFTAEERAAIRAAALVNGAVADLCAMTDKADMIHFDDPLTVEGISRLEATGLIAPGRGAQILSI